ncbi:MAG: hypothetical protein M3Z04_14340, partial [Chloroflexota bacterium]|nr:hypothetical protein [Chloroflexota bacterium]
AGARAAFARAGDYRDAALHVRQLAPQVQALETHYSDGVRLAGTGAWWDAAHALRQAAAIQVSYMDVITRLHSAQAQVGPIFYRAPGPDGILSLWAAESDGSAAQRLLSGSQSEPAALSPDGRWLVYSFGPLATAGSDPDGPFLLDRQTGRLTSLAQRFRDLAGPLRVQFRNDSSGFWWSYDNATFSYDLTTRSSRQLTELPAAYDPAGKRLLFNRFLLPSLDAAHSRLLLGNDDGQERSQLADEPGFVLNPAFSDDGRYLLYTVQDRPVGDTVTVTVVLHDLAAPAGAQRSTLLTSPVARAMLESTTVQAAFLPGSHSVLTFSPVSLHNTGWTLRRWTNGTPTTLLTAGGEWISPPRPQLWPLPGTDWLAVQTPTGVPTHTTLSLLGPTGTVLPVGHDLRAGTWADFTSDGQQALISLSDFGSPDGGRVLRVVSLGRDATGGLTIRRDANLPLAIPAAQSGSDPRYSRDGKRLLLIDGGGETGLYAVQLDGNDPIPLAKDATAFWTGRALSQPLFAAPPPPGEVSLR